MVLVHNVWAVDWRVLITLLGWINFLLGGMSIVFPGQTMAFRKILSVNGPPVVAVVMAIIGPTLIYHGYSRTLRVDTAPPGLRLGRIRGVSRTGAEIPQVR